jgi:hypothetical protein
LQINSTGVHAISVGDIFSDFVCSNASAKILASGPSAQIINSSNCGSAKISLADGSRCANLAGVGILDFGQDTSGPVSDARAEDISCTSVIDINDDRNVLIGVRCTSGYTVGASADDTEIIGGRVGPTGGGGASTITVAAGANRTRIVGVATDAAIVDGGTGTALAANTVY